MPAPAAPLTMNMGDMLSPPSPVSFPEARSEPRIGAASPSIVRTGMPTFARPIQFDANVDVHASSVSAPSSTVMAKRPAMPLSSRPMAEDSLVVQRAGSSPTAPVSGASAPAGGSSAAGGGAKPDDVSLLAGEVWSILKRRLAFEAQRAGRSQRLR
ncbi:hypothetical protein EON79_23975 [bacterium]|nr:MAG: hypothetical protein EON79_23975 [bacterium]